VVLPFLSNILAVEQAIIDTSSNATAVADSRNKKTQLTSSISGWQSVLDRNSQLMANASTGKLKQYEVTQLVADALLQDENGVDNVKYINGTKAPDANKLRSISAISFGGAGALITYTDKSINSSSDTSTSSTTLQSEAGLVYADKLMFGGFGLYVTSSLLHQGLYDDTDGSTESTDKSRTRSFSLGDADQGDYFDVQVFTDPVFGSYVFSTMSGQSRYAFSLHGLLTFILM
jgi:hypothetical protein